MKTNKEATIALISFLLVLFVYTLIFSIQIHGYKKQIKQLRKENAELKLKIDSLETAPWLSSAYIKCKFGASENFVRDCIAFEIKELRH